MLQVTYISQNTEDVKKRLAVKHFPNPAIVDSILALDKERKQLQAETDNAQAQINSLSKEIGANMAKGNKEEAESKKQEVANLKKTIQPLAEKLTAVELQLQAELVTLPNLPSPLVPEGRSPEDNVVVKEGGTIPNLGADSLPHWELTEKYNLINFELGNKITGSGFPVYMHQGARLQRALVNYFLDFNTSAGYAEYQPALMVNEASAFGTGQLPDKEGQMYHATEDNFFLIPTSEVPLTNIYRDEIIDEKKLPIKMTAYTPCFRREAGSYGKDVRGLNRLHQFDKVELVQIVQPEGSYNTLQEMVDHVERLLQSLELPYRILRLCGGDMGFASALTYDFEVYSTAQQRWLEVSSVSNFETFQTHRMKIRVKDENGKTKLLHSLNGSSLALPRIVACLLENNQTAEGIKLPAALVPFFGKPMID